FILEVIGTTVTVSECVFAILLLIIKAGRHPSWTLVPGCSPSSANQTSPRCGMRSLCCVCRTELSSLLCTCSGFRLISRLGFTRSFLEYEDFFLLFFLPTYLTSV